MLERCKVEGRGVGMFFYFSMVSIISPLNRLWSQYPRQHFASRSRALRQTFHPTSGIDVTAVGQVQADLRLRILHAFVGRGLLESCDAKDMLGFQHSGFSVDAGVYIGSHDRTATLACWPRATDAWKTKTRAIPVLTGLDFLSVLCTEGVKLEGKARLQTATPTTTHFRFGLNRLRFRRAPEFVK